MFRCSITEAPGEPVPGSMTTTCKGANSSKNETSLVERIKKFHGRDNTKTFLHSTFLPHLTHKLRNKSMRQVNESYLAEDIGSKLKEVRNIWETQYLKNVPNNEKLLRQQDLAHDQTTLLLPAYSIASSAIIFQSEMYFTGFKDELFQPNTAIFYNNWYRTILRVLTAFAHLQDGKNLAEGTQPWRYRFNYLFDVVPKFMRPFFFWVPKKEFDQEDNRMDFFKKYCLYAFGSTLDQWQPPYDLPEVYTESQYTRSMFRDDVEMREKVHDF